MVPSVVLALCYCFLILWFSIFISHFGQRYRNESSQILKHNNDKIGWILSHDTQIYWSRYEFEKNCARLSPRTIFFKTHSSTNISVYHAQSIQFYIRLGHKNPWLMAFMSYDQNGVRGHVGVTGVKKVKN